MNGNQQQQPASGGSSQPTSAPAHGPQHQNTSGNTGTSVQVHTGGETDSKGVPWLIVILVALLALLVGVIATMGVKSVSPKDSGPVEVTITNMPEFPDEVMVKPTPGAVFETRTTLSQPTEGFKVQGYQSVAASNDRVASAIDRQAETTKSSLDKVAESLTGVRDGLASINRNLDYDRTLSGRERQANTRVAPEKVKPTGNASPPTEWRKEQTTERLVQNSEVTWKLWDGGKYYIPLWKTNNRAVTQGSSPTQLTKPKGWESARWVVINQTDWALKKKS